MHALMSMGEELGLLVEEMEGKLGVELHKAGLVAVTQILIQIVH